MTTTTLTSDLWLYITPVWLVVWFLTLSDRANPRSGSTQTSPSGSPVCSHRGRQLPAVPPKGAVDKSTSVRDDSYLSGDTSNQPIRQILSMIQNLLGRLFRVDLTWTGSCLTTSDCSSFIMKFYSEIQLLSKKLTSKTFKDREVQVLMLVLCQSSCCVLIYTS